MLNIWIALLITFLSALVWLRLNDLAAHRGWVSSQVSRKIVHMGTGPIYVLCWLLFPDTMLSRYLASLVPLLFTIQFALIGFGIIKDEATVKSLSRSGDPKEILRGPVFYGIIFVIVTIFYWYENPIGIIALMLMCGGDGLADIIGRRWGKAKLPWSKDKSWVGSFGMFLGGWLFALGVIAAFIAAGKFSGSLSDFLMPITLIALAGTAIETLPIRDIDNITVTGLAILLGHYFF